MQRSRRDFVRRDMFQPALLVDPPRPDIQEHSREVQRGNRLLALVPTLWRRKHNLCSLLFFLMESIHGGRPSLAIHG